MECDDVVALSYLDINVIENDSVVNMLSNNFIFVVRKDING